jgi:hypothetical protein
MRLYADEDFPYPVVEELSFLEGLHTRTGMIYAKV